MQFDPASRRGPNEVAVVLGRGGTGEAYRARETRFHREVAFKILPAALGADANRRARLEREAVAALSDPNMSLLEREQQPL